MTRDSVEGLAEQLDPPSIMAMQNRIALDMLLAKDRGACQSVGISDICCTYIPNNTAPDRSVSRALEELRILSNTMHEHSGVNNPSEEWMYEAFGKWKGLVMSAMMSIATFLAILITCGCCCVPYSLPTCSPNNNNN